MNLHVLEKGAVKRIAFVAVLLAVLAIVLAAAPPEADADTIVTAPGEVTWTLDDTGLPTVEGAAGPMPAAFFTGEAAGITVNVIAEAGAFDQKVEMVLAPVYDPAVLEQIAEGVGTAARNVTAIDIAFVNADGEEVEPLAPVKVTLVSDAIGEAARIAHLDNGGIVEEMEAEISGGTAAFESGAFSIYAVVKAGDDDRLLVKFVGSDGEIASMYVKKGDTMGQVIYDPGAGNLADGVFFRGWTTKSNYDSETVALTIADVRAELAVILNTEDGFDWPVVETEDGYVVTYYAMLFNLYRITYYSDVDNKISVGQDSVVFRADDTHTYQSYTVNMPYTPESSEYNFEGWLVVDGINDIDNYENRPYQNLEEINIKGDVEFSVSAPEGHWLVFNENGKGATYVAARFIKSGDSTEEPNVEMKRLGYTFEGLLDDHPGSGWYTPQLDENGEVMLDENG